MDDLMATCHWGKCLLLFYAVFFSPFPILNFVMQLQNVILLYDRR